jgi:hypothetical protein
MEHLYYHWSAGGATVSVDLDSELITRLREATQESSGTTGWEVGGILLGSRISDEQITVSDFEIVTSEHRRGMTFTLSPADRKRLDKLLRQEQKGKTIIGGFRTHRRPGLFMDQYDFDLMARYFPSPTDVMLLIRPKDWCAGFFVWEEGDIRRQKSYLEFSFSPALLPLKPRPEPVEKSDVPITPAPELSPLPPAAPVSTPPRVLLSIGRLPILARVGLIFATLGLVGVLAFYAHQKFTPSTLASSTPPVRPQPALAKTAPASITDPYEFHVKLPDAERPSPFVEPQMPIEPQTADPPIPKRAKLTHKKVLALPEPRKSPVAPHPEVTPQLPAAPPISRPVEVASITPAIASHSLPRLGITPVVSVEPAPPSAFSRGFSHVPLLGLGEKHKLKARENFQPAKPIHEVRPKLPLALQQQLQSGKQIDVKIWINDQGVVTKAELPSQAAKSEVGDLSAHAALQWKFHPAQLEEKPVASEMVLHFHFVPASTIE